MFENASVLVVEDEPFIALDLALAVEEAGGVVIGPAASVKDALSLLETSPVSGAILDVNLVDRDISPVVYWLVQRGIPLVLQTGVGLPHELAASVPDLVIYLKPTPATVLVDVLKTLMTDSST